MPFCLCRRIFLCYNKRQNYQPYSGRQRTIRHAKFASQSGCSVMSKRQADCEDPLAGALEGGICVFNILVVEDNPDMRELFCTVLSDGGYRAVPAADGEEALEIMDKEYIDLIVADIMMPRMDGYELTKVLRDAGYELPILMVTAKDQFEDIRSGFRAGTDDYMIKPVNVKEMVLRVEALLRRAKISSEKKIVVGSTVLNYDALTVTIRGEETLLPQKEFYLLYKLLSYPNKIFTRQQLMDEIWGMFSETDERTVNTHINRLRDRFRDCKDFEIITVRGLGYKAVKKVE